MRTADRCRKRLRSVATCRTRHAGHTGHAGNVALGEGDVGGEEASELVQLRLYRGGHPPLLGLWEVRTRAGWGGQQRGDAVQQGSVLGVGEREIAHRVDHRGIRTHFVVVKLQLQRSRTAVVKHAIEARLPIAIQLSRSIEGVALKGPLIDYLPILVQNTISITAVLEGQTVQESALIHNDISLPFCHHTILELSGHIAVVTADNLGNSPLLVAIATPFPLLIEGVILSGIQKGARDGQLHHQIRLRRMTKDHRRWHLVIVRNDTMQSAAIKLGKDPSVPLGERGQEQHPSTGVLQQHLSAETVFIEFQVANSLMLRILHQ